MQYLVDCECGSYVSVEETDAGTTTLCTCGRTVVIPSLRELRRSAGQTAPVSPELTIESLLLAGELPEETNCVLCGERTDSSVCCKIQCEQALVRSGRPSLWAYLLAGLTLGWLGLAILKATQQEDKEWGKDRLFPLPLRICVSCRQRLKTPAEVKEALCQVPLYEQLLMKYPKTRVLDCTVIQ
jgi:hypothetical protein